MPGKRQAGWDGVTGRAAIICGYIQRGRPPLGGRPRMAHRGNYSPAFNALTMPLPNPLA